MFYFLEFMNFFGIVYIVSTTFILFFKQEKNLVYEKYLDNNLSIKTTFNSLLDVLKLKPVQKLIIILLTCKVKIFKFYKIIICYICLLYIIFF